MIHDPHNKRPGYKLGQPIEGAVKALTILERAGHTIIIHTVWAANDHSIKTIKDWLSYFKIPYHEVTNIKPQADVYIDDKAIRFYDWYKALEDIDLIGHNS